VSEVVGAAIVEVIPETRGFATRLQTESARAATAAGRTAGRNFQASFGRNVATIAAGAGLGFGLITAVQAFRRLGVESVRAAADQERANALLARSIRAARAESTLYGESIEQVLQEQGLLTGVADDELIPAFTTLLRVTNNTETAFQRLKLAQDIQAQTGRDLRSITVGLARAQGGQIAGLSRLGILLPGITADMSRQERATRALSILTQKFGGDAEAAAERGAGTFRRFNVAIGELKESIGAALLPEVTKIADRTADWLGKTENQERVQRNVRSAVEATSGAVQGLSDAIEFGTFVLSPFIQAFKDVRAQSFELGQNLAEFTFDVKDAFGAIGDFFTGAESQAEKTARLIEQLQETRGLRRRPEEGTAAADIAAQQRAAEQQVEQAVAQQARLPFRSQRSIRFQIELLQAQRTEQTQDDLRILRDRQEFIQGLIRRFENAGDLGRKQRAELLALYQEQASVEGDITSIQDDIRRQQEEAAEDRRQRLEEQRQRLQEERAQEAERRRLAAEQARDERERARQLRETRLQIRVQRAELTETTADDRRALVALRNFYAQQSRSFRQQGALLRSAQAEANRLSTISQIRGLNQQDEGTGSTVSIFQEAVSNFRAFGSNIAGRGGILSPQDARAALAFGVLQTKQERLAELQVTTNQGQLTEQQRTNSLLEVIAQSVAPGFRGGPTGVYEQTGREAANLDASKITGLFAGAVGY
jgi:hypothetical protein